MSFYLFILWTFILIGRPQDVFPSLVPLRLAFVFTIITLLATFLGNKKISLHDLFKLKESKRYALFYMLMIIGIPFAYHRREAFNYIFLLYLSNILFFYIFISQVDSFRKLKSIIFTVSLSILFYGVFSLTKGSYSYGYLGLGSGENLSWIPDQRFSFGTMYDPNDLAYFLVSLFPLSFFYIVHKEGVLKKIFSITTALVSVGVILRTGSRGGFIGLVGVSILFFFTKLVDLKLSFKVLLLVASVIVLMLYGSNINMERFKSLTGITADYNITADTGRLGIWKRGFRLILSNPITGVGVNCFGKAIGEMRDAEGVIPEWQVAHNSFIQIAAEVGLIAFGLFTSLVFGCMKTLSRGRKIEVFSSEAREFKTMAGLLQVGFIGHLITALFLTQGYSILFTLFFALSAVTRKLSFNYDNRH